MKVAKRKRSSQSEIKACYIQSFVAEKPRDDVLDAILYAVHVSDLDVSMICRESGYLWISQEKLDPAFLNKCCEYPFNDPFTHRPIDTFMGWSARSLKSGYGPVLGKVCLSVLVTSNGALSSLIIKSRWEARNEKDSHVCLLYTSPSPRDATLSRMPSSA